MTLMEELAAILDANLPSQEDPVQLAAILYNRCYTASLLDPPAPAAHPEDLTPLLAAANQSRAAWEEGWKIDQLLDEGRIFARKGSAARTFLPGEYLTHRGIGSGPAADAMVTIFVPPDSTDLQPEFYYAFSETVSEFEENENVVRFYWNISKEGAPCLLENITREFNRFQIPFRFKCGRRGSNYPRRDAAVLYLHACYYRIAALVIASIHQRVLPWLESGTPLFSKRLADGLGFAEDPGESFGEHRMKIVAAAMASTCGKPTEERLNAVRREFQERGLSLDQPWLNPGAVDCYDFP